VLSEAVELVVGHAVVESAAWLERPPHEAVGVAEHGGEVRSEAALVVAQAVLLRPDGGLDELQLGVDADVLPHRYDRLAYLLLVVQKDVALRLDVDLLVRVPGLPEKIPSLGGIERHGLLAGVVREIARAQEAGR